MSPCFPVILLAGDTIKNTYEFDIRSSQHPCCPPGILPDQVRAENQQERGNPTKICQGVSYCRSGHECTTATPSYALLPQRNSLEISTPGDWGEQFKNSVEMPLQSAGACTRLFHGPIPAEDPGGLLEPSLQSPTGRAPDSRRGTQDQKMNFSPNCISRADRALMICPAPGISTVAPGMPRLTRLKRLKNSARN